jgi:hypothetical protein
MDRCTGGCLYGNVRIVALDSRWRVASPGCRHFRPRDDKTAIATPQVALRSRSHERCKGRAFPVNWRRGQR